MKNIGKGTNKAKSSKGKEQGYRGRTRACPRDRHRRYYYGLNGSGFLANRNKRCRCSRGSGRTWGSATKGASRYDWNQYISRQSILITGQSLVIMMQGEERVLFGRRLWQVGLAVICILNNY